MFFSPNDRIHGFLVNRVRRSDELHAVLVEMIHLKTGARLCWLNNGLENKVFSISFRTLPTDNTGVFHILEHSVLCGSDRFPVREPFVELLKGSMNTFLNAMTFPDMTMYPVSSRNDQDLLNLTEVYLDAVFRPRILQDERIFCQEGWHIESDENGHYQYKGVVFSEMKGAMSDISQVGEAEMARQLFPDTGYGFNSGGDPEAIPTLTYQQFLAAYRRHYHPSNAWIYLDGTVPMERILTLINAYLDVYEAETDLPVFSFQKPASSFRTAFYELGKEEDARDKGHLYLSRIFGSWKDKTLNMAANVVGDVLTGHNSAPLKRLVLENGLAQDFSLSVDDSSFQSVLTMHAENVTDGREQELTDLINRFADRLEREGLDRSAVEASLNRFIFNMKEEEEPQGIERAVRVMGSWLYDGDPLFSLENDQEFAELRQMLASGDLNALAVSMLKDRNGLCTLKLLPSKDLGTEKREAEEKRLAEIASRWSSEEQEVNKSLLSSLQAWQDTPDLPEALATLPALKKADADLPAEWPETEVRNLEGTSLLYHPLPCSGVVHLRAYINLSGMAMESLQDVSLLCALLGKLPTEHYDGSSLQQEIKRYTGRLGFSVVIRGDPLNPERCTPYLVAFTSVLRENVQKAEFLLAEILKTTDFSDTDRIVEIVLQLEMLSRQRIVSGGHTIGIRSVLSHYSAEMALRNALEGDLGVCYLHEFAASPDHKLPGLRATAEKLRMDFVVRKRMTLSMTADESVTDWSEFLCRIPSGSAGSLSVSFSRQAPLRQGYRIPSQVGFSVRGWHLREAGQPFRGSLFLAANILTYSWLWNQVRVQGGAYGCSFQADRFGNLFTYSYRDPSPDRTLLVDRGASGFLKSFVDSGEDLDKYIISTLNDLNPLLSPREKGILADSRFFSGYTREEADRIRREILCTTSKDLLEITGLLDDFAEKGAVCVVASGAQLDKCPNLILDDL